MTDGNEIKGSYQLFFDCMSRGYGMVNNTNDSCSSPRFIIEGAELFYNILECNGVEDIEHLRGSLNTLRQKLGMEVKD